MPREVTLAELREAARLLTDTDEDPHKTDAWIDTLINDARKEVHEIILRADPDFFEDEQTILTTGTAAGRYPLPDDHHLTKGVEWLAYGGTYVPLGRVRFRDRLKYQRPGGGTGVNAEAYRLVAGNVELLPPPPAGQTYRHVYVPAAELLEEEGDTVDGREAELIKLRVAIHLAIREEADTAPLERAFDRELSRMIATVEDRAMNETTVIEDVEDFSDDGWHLPMPRRL